MSERGRKPGFHMTEEHRTKIANSQILNRLIRAAEGEIDISPTQASVGLGLLRKVMPDLAATTISGDDENPLKVETTIIELVAAPFPVTPENEGKE